MDILTVRHLWRLACGDAGVADGDVVFLPYTKDPAGTMYPASFHPPGDVASSALHNLLDADAAKAIDWQTSKRRIAVWVGMDDRAIAPVLRHELEHARQWQLGGGTPTFRLAAAIQRVLDACYGDLPYSGQIYNLSPHELDANGAASRFIRKLHGDEQADSLANDPQLDTGLFRRRPVPEPPDTLPTRLICHAGVWPDCTEEVFSQVGNLMGLLGSASPGGPELWSRLGEDPTMQQLVEDVRRTIPTKVDIESAASPQDGWLPHKTSIIAARDRARSLADLQPTPRYDL
jgi:hypothetical protein